ncbi:MAG: type II secretion system GspH family protein [Parachlamydiales bacterium]|nr:type II secretion system GspH family protein [Parachlamydiales bacterium]
MKKRTLTLIEIMIVILLITIIGGAVGYNMKGSLDKGKKFRTEQGKEQLRNLLLMCLDDEKDVTGEQLASNPAYWLKKSGLAKDADKAIVDGWGKKYTITFNSETKDFEIQ